MYILLVCYSMLVTLCISVIEMNPFGSDINSHQTNSDYRTLRENGPTSTLKSKGKQLLDDCLNDVDCYTHINNSECVNAICHCRSGFRETHNKDSTYGNNNSFKACHAIDTNVNDKLQKETTIPTPPPEKMDGTHMLPIMIVLGIMFIGMCVALNLFSRAQFRNNRSLFASNNSHIVKSTSRSSAHRRASSSHPTLASVAQQHRTDSTGSFSLAIDSPSHPLKGLAEKTIIESSPLSIDKQQRTNRVLDNNCISYTTIGKVNLMSAKEENG